MLTRTTDGPTSLFEGPTRLLVVDDDPILLEFARAQLAYPAVTVVTAQDGEDAWAILNGNGSAERFDLVLSDLDMPRLNGFGLLGRIRDCPRHADLPVVVITSRDDVFAIDRAYEVGAASFVTKPVNWRLLRYQLRYVLRASRMEGQLREARRAAERSAALKENLLTLLQHETRTPLNAVVGYAELLRGARIEPADLASCVGQLLESARSLEGTLRRIFFFSQLAAGTLSMDQEPIRLDHLVEETMRATRGPAERAGVTLAFERVGGASPIVACDIGHLSTALRELILNAIAHAPDASSVRLTLREGADGGAVLDVQDDGPGLDPLVLAGGFEAFVQETDPLTRRGEGLGLGLATAARIIELHGGRLEIVARPGAGGCARIVLPAVRPMARSGERAAASC